MAHPDGERSQSGLLIAIVSALLLMGLMGLGLAALLWVRAAPTGPLLGSDPPLELSAASVFASTQQVERVSVEPDGTWKILLSAEMLGSGRQIERITFTKIDAVSPPLGPCEVDLPETLVSPIDFVVRTPRVPAGCNRVHIGYIVVIEGKDLPSGRPFRDDESSWIDVDRLPPTKDER